MMPLKQLILLMVLLMICISAASCSVTRETVYVPSDAAVQLRKRMILPVWVRDKDGTIKEAYVEAWPYWLIGPPK